MTQEALLTRSTCKMIIILHILSMKYELEYQS